MRGIGRLLEQPAAFFHGLASLMKGLCQETGIWQGRNAGTAAGLPDSAILIGKQAMPAWEARLLETQKTLPVPHRISAPALPASGSEAACACPARSG